MKKLQMRIFHMGMMLIFIFVCTLLYSEKEMQVFEEKKYVALTYDDGPSQLTTQPLIDLLDKYNASATFFINGNHANENKELVKNIYHAGNEIGNHTLDHVWLTKMDQKERERQIYGNESLLKFLSGQEGKMLVRPPYGDINQDILDTFDIPFIMWNVDSRDWEVRNAAAIQSNVLSHIEDGDIIIMHDGYTSTIKATEEILKRLNSEGFEVVSVSELFQLKNEEIPLHEKVKHCRK